MTLRQDSAKAVVRIRPTRPLWIAFFGLGAAFFAMAALLDSQPWLTVLEVAIGAVNVSVGLALRILGVDLTPDFAIVRNLRRRRVPWPQVQGVVSRDNSSHASLVLIFEGGEPLTLGYPGPVGRKGGTQCERDFHTINEWWIEHRGDSWRPVRPESPLPPTHG